MKSRLLRARPDYWTFLALLGILTLVEWLLYVQRDAYGIGPGVLVPSLLALSGLKFAMVVAWYMHLRDDPGWAKKAMPAALVLCGGTALALQVLISP